MLKTIVEYIKNLKATKPEIVADVVVPVDFTTQDINDAINYAISVANAVPNMSLRSSVIFQLEKAKEFAKII